MYYMKIMSHHHRYPPSIWGSFPDRFCGLPVPERHPGRLGALYVKRPVRPALVVELDELVYLAKACQLPLKLAVGLGWCGRELSSMMLRSSSSSSNSVGVQLPLGVPRLADVKQLPLSESIWAGVPNSRMALRSTRTAFSEVACSKTPNPVMRREESSRYACQIELFQAWIPHFVPVHVPHCVGTHALIAQPLALPRSSGRAACDSTAQKYPRRYSSSGRL